MRRSTLPYRTMTDNLPAYGQRVKNPLAPFFAQQGYVVIDGALASELERHGADLRDPLWSAKLLLEDPDLIGSVHTAYLHAGADVIATASYQATVEGFISRGLSANEAEDLLRLSVTLATDARDEFWAVEKNRRGRLRPLVAASIGPYGAYLANGSEYRGDYGLSEEELIAFHRPRVEILSETQADLLAFETIPSLVEGSAIIRLLNDVSSIPAWLAFSCRDGERVSHGEPLAECAAIAEECQAVVAVGVNCTAPCFIEPLIAAARKATTKPIIVYPNSGEGWDSRAGAWTASPHTDRIGALATTWRRAGADIIGGCCRTTPEDIAEVRAAMQDLR
jgi:homocysteine S-methyltransferase